MTAPFGRLALHTWTLETTPLKAAIAAAKAGGFDAVELRRSDFKACFDRGMSNGQVLDLIREGGLPVACLGVEYGWMFADGEESERLFEVFRDTCENAVELGCDLIMSAPGQNAGPMADAIDNTRRAGAIAAAYDLRFAIEFNSQHAVINNVESLRELLAGVDMDHVGMLLDAYHLARTGRTGRSFDDVMGSEIAAFQFSDAPPLPPEEKRPIDRLMPGEGVIDWEGMLGLLKEKGYRGYLSFEAPNPAHWERPPEDVAAEAVKRTRAIVDRVNAAA